MTRVGTLAGVLGNSPSRALNAYEKLETTQSLLLATRGKLGKQFQENVCSPKCNQFSIYMQKQGPVTLLAMTIKDRFYGWVGDACFCQDLIAQYSEPPNEYTKSKF